MKRIQYSRFEEDDLGLSAEDLMRMLGDLLLDSGYSGFNELTMEQLREALKKALEERQLFMVYQPELDATEREIINTHSLETFQLLRHLHGLEDIAEWAAHHHEEPGGGGYPFQLDASTLPLESRILRIADIFQAMVQDRPYRRGLDKIQAFAFMADLAAQGLAEVNLVDQLIASGDEAMAAARASVQRPGN